MTSGCKTETGTPRVDSMTESCDSARHDSLCLTRPAGARRQSCPVESGPGNNTPRPATACPGLPARSRIEVNLFIILSPPPERPSSPRPRKASEQCQSTQLRLGLRQPSTSLGKPYSWEDRVPGKPVSFFRGSLLHLDHAGSFDRVPKRAGHVFESRSLNQTGTQPDCDSLALLKSFSHRKHTGLHRAKTVLGSWRNSDKMQAPTSFLRRTAVSFVQTNSKFNKAPGMAFELTCSQSAVPRSKRAKPDRIWIS